MEEIVAFTRRGFRGGVPHVGGRPHEQIYDVGGMPVDERPDHPVVKIIESATAKRKTIIGKIDYRRRRVELAVEPWLHCVLIGGRHIGEMVGEE